jgi:L-fuculose-phosphate aldolase
MKYETIRKQVLDAILEATSLGLIHGTSGNIAVRDFNDNVIAITPSGRPYNTMTVEDIAIVSMTGEWLDGPYKPSSETPMHTAVFRARPDVGATVHLHGLYCTVMAMTGNELLPTTPPQAEFSPIRVVPFEMPGSKELAQHVVSTLGSGSSVLLKNHGSFFAGKDIKAAMSAAIYTEEAAQVAYYGKLIGSFQPLPENVILGIQEMIAADKAV